ncbi:hypothetical protein [Streptomyces sp. NPDC093514]|uniref:hypothetical protein n=1 Tax=Streptomyces sp. NPDC093514 TaxID=3366039 RepID=UPI00380F0F4C
MGPAIIGTKKITACLPIGTLQELAGLDAYFAAESRRAKSLPMARTDGLTRREAAARRTLWEQQKVQLRRQGQLVDSRRALVIAALVKVIAQRGWERLDWRSVPGQTRGRWVGSPEGAWPETLTVELPIDLVWTVLAGCLDVSRPATDELYKWHERNPRAHPNRPVRPRCSPAELAEYHSLASEVLTLGQVWRDAVRAGIDTAIVARPGSRLG